MLKYVILLSVCMLLSCSNQEEKIPAESLRRETYHFFSNRNSKDHLVLEFLSSSAAEIKPEYTYFDVLSGKFMLSIYQSDRTIFHHIWAVSDCFSMADNHYLTEDEKIKKVLHVVEHFFDNEKFRPISDLKITGVLKSSDSTYQREIENDPNSLGFSFIQEDFCVIHARTSDHAVLLRALSKDILRRYNLLNESTDLSTNK